MSAVITDPPLTRFKLCVDQYHRMVELGILREDERVELIDGELIRMAPIGSLHGGLVAHLTHLLVTRTGGRAVIWPQSSVILSEVTEPQPDLAVLRWRADWYTSRTPTAADAALVIEVADSSLRYDRDVKLRYYARAGVPEAWVVDARGRCILRYAERLDDGYRVAQVLTAGAVAQCEALPELAVTVGELFGVV
jgi:Uma2 family endonuclease